MSKETNINIKVIHIDELIPSEYNPRIDLKPSDKEYQKLKKSIIKFDYIDPIIWNEKTKRVVGGHQRLKIMKDLGYENIQVSVVSFNELEEKALNIGLNKTGGDWDYTKLPALLEEIRLEFMDEDLDIEVTGFDLDEINDLTSEFMDEESDEESVTLYTDKIKIPNYEPTTEKPNIPELFDKEVSNELIKRIEQSDIPREEKEFLKIASYRHIVFDYHNIAEYYAHSSKQVQELMEESTLVIIDFDKAIENGFVQFVTEVMGLQEEDEEHG